MQKPQQIIFSRNSREWIPVTRHRAGWYSSPNNIHVGDGYMVGRNGYPVPTLRWVDAAGNEKGRFKGGFAPDAAYEEGDEIHARVVDLQNISVFYVRYNQIKEIPFDLGLLTNTRTLGFRRNYVQNLGHVDMSNSPFLENVDFSDNGSLTQLTLHPNAPVNFFYLGGTSLPQWNIDYLLQHAVDSGIVNGTLNYSGRPSYDATDNYATLVDRGWNMSLSPHAGTVEKLGDTAAGVSNGELITASHRVTFRAMNADGTIRHAGAFSGTHAGDLPDFEENGWIETEYYHPSILQMKVSGKQLKTLNLDHLVSLQNGDFSDNNIQTVSAANITNLESLNLKNNPIASLTGLGANPMTFLNVEGSNLGSTAIDDLLAQLVAGGQSNGTFIYDVKPTTAGVADWDILDGRGWILSIEPDRNVPAKNLVFTNITDDAFTVTWDKATGNVNNTERVLYRVVGATSWESGLSTTGNTDTISGLVSNTTYEVAIFSELNDGGNLVSEVSTVTTQVALTPATNLNFTNIQAYQFTLNWTKGQNGEASERVYWRKIGVITWSSFDTTGNSMTISNREPDTEYEVKVRTFAVGGGSYVESAISTVITGIVAPSNLVISNVGSTEFTATWDKGAGGSDNEYVRYRPVGSTDLFDSVSTTGNSITVTGLNPDTQYEVHVRRFPLVGYDYEDSATVNVTTETATAPTPTNVTTSDVTETSFRLNWDAVSGATAYRVQWRKAGTSTWNTEVDTVLNRKTILNLGAGATYEARVASVNDAGVSPYSEIVTQQLLQVQAQPATDVIFTNVTTSSATISWTKGVNVNTTETVQGRQLGDTTWVDLNSTTGNSATISGLSSGTTYEVRIKSIKSSDGTPIYSSIVQGTTNSAATIDPDYQAVLDFATAQGIPHPSSTENTRRNQIVIDLKATGQWVEDEGVFILSGVADIAFKLICHKRRILATAHGSLTWSSNGVKGNAANAYINPQVGVNTTKYIVNSASIGFRTFDVGTGGLRTIVGGYTAGNNTAYTFITPNNGTASYWNVNIKAGGTSTSGGAFHSTQYTQIDRSSDVEQQLNGGERIVSWSSAGQKPNSIFILARALNGSPDSYGDQGIAFIRIGGEAQTRYAAIKAVADNI